MNRNRSFFGNAITGYGHQAYDRENQTTEVHVKIIQLKSGKQRDNYRQKPGKGKQSIRVLPVHLTQDDVN